MNVYGGIVLYNPDVQILLKNIDSIINQVDKLVIIDNGSKNINEILQCGKKYNYTLIQNGENLGIAKALNQLLQFGDNEGVDWVITLDQDSISPKNLVERLTAFCSDEIGILSPNFIDRNTNENIGYKHGSTISYEQWTISSGSLTSVKAWKNIGGFDEKLFIDGVDIDYGIRLNRYGYKVVKVNDITISHTIGESYVRRVFGIKVLVKNHSPFRKYYIARNTIYLSRKNGSILTEIKSYLQILKLLVVTTAFEKDKINKNSRIITGMIDGIKMKKVLNEK